MGVHRVPFVTVIQGTGAPIWGTKKQKPPDWGAWMRFQNCGTMDVPVMRGITSEMAAADLWRLEATAASVSRVGGRGL